GGKRLGNELFFEIQQLLQPAPLLGVFCQPYLLQAQVFDLLLQLAVLGPHAAQVKIVVPPAGSCVLSPDQRLLERSNCAYRPHPDQAALLGICRALHLDGQSQHLGKQNRHQDARVPVTAEKVIHDYGFQLLVSGFERRLGMRRQLFSSTRARTRNSKPETRNYSIEIFRSSLKSLSIFPMPSTTLHSGSSAIETGRPVSSRIRLSRFFSSAPPPVKTMPRSLMSADSSGGMRSRATRMAFMIVETHSLNDSRTSLSSTVMVLGTPSIRLRPLISIVKGLSSGYADPISILICSAVRSPISRLYLRFR